MTDRLKVCGTLALACILALAHPSATFAQSMTIVVPFAAGGTSDIAMRTIASKVEELGGPRFLIENRPGGGGVTAAIGVRDAAPDGRTLFLANYATFVVNPAMAATFPFDPSADFKPVTTLFSFPLMLAVPSNLEARSVAELVALAKQKPGGLAYGLQGIGTAGHLLGELFAKGSGAPLVHVPYKGAAQGVVDLVAGRVDIMFIGVLPTKTHRASGALRALGVASKTRMVEMPTVPTMQEAGYPDVNTDFVWFGLAAPAKTPDAVIKTLNETFAKAAAASDVQQGVSVEASTPAQFAARIKADTAKFGPLIKASGAAK